MKKMLILILLLSGIYLITHSFYVKIFLTASIISYLVIHMITLFTLIYGVIKTSIKNGIIDTLKELEFQSNEAEKVMEESKAKKQEILKNIEKLLNIKF